MWIVLPRFVKIRDSSPGAGDERRSDKKAEEES
jgi:hypothetical protein